MGRKETLGKDANGVYRRYLGWKAVAGGEEGKVIQHLFRLGRDEGKARLANLRLEALWAAVVARWQRLEAAGAAETQRPLWDDVTLAIGQAISKGEPSCPVSPPAAVARLSVEMQVA